MALGVREARAHVDLAFDAASTQPPSPQAEVQDCGDVAERLAKVLAERDGWDWEKDGTSLTRQMMLDQARSILKAIQPDRSPFVAPEQVDTGEPFEDGGEDAEQAAEDTRNGTGKQPPAEPQGDVVEILARFEFDRLEMGDLRIVGGPLKWEQAGESERGELLDRAREILAAITPLLALEVKERLREKALSNEAVEAFGTGYWRAVSEKQQLQRQQRHGEAKDIALFRRGLEAWLDYLDTPAPSEEER
jgi:hypothetical protein